MTIKLMVIILFITMKFYNRHAELELLRSNLKWSADVACCYWNSILERKLTLRDGSPKSAIIGTVGGRMRSISLL